MLTLWDCSCNLDTHTLVYLSSRVSHAAAWASRTWWRCFHGDGAGDR